MAVVGSGHCTERGMSRASRSLFIYLAVFLVSFAPLQPCSSPKSACTLNYLQALSRCWGNSCEQRVLAPIELMLVGEAGDKHKH